MKQTNQAAKDAKAAATKAAKEASDKAKAEKAAATKAAKDKKIADAEAKKAEAAAAKEAKIAKAAADKAAKEANRQPEQNGVRRPGPDGKCGKAWAIFDSLSATLKQPVPIADALVKATAEGHNESNVRTEYARWKKFHGIAGRVTKPAEAAPAQAATA